MDEHSSARRAAQESLAPFGTCCRVESLTAKMESIEGRELTVRVVGEWVSSGCWRSQRSQRKVDWPKLNGLEWLHCLKIEDGVTKTRPEPEMIDTV